jgi:hypothetical protein
MDDGDFEIYRDEQKDEDTALEYMIKALDACVKFDDHAMVRHAIDGLRKRIEDVAGMRMRGERSA